MKSGFKHGENWAVELNETLRLFKRPANERKDFL